MPRTPKLSQAQQIQILNHFGRTLMLAPVPLAEHNDLQLELKMLTLHLGLPVIDGTAATQAAAAEQEEEATPVEDESNVTPLPTKRTTAKKRRK